MIDRNRAPFDLIEGERELIRGFNIEIRRLLFVILFLREYGVILVLALIGGRIQIRRLLVLIFLFLVLLCRSCFPRVRYDALISFI